MSNYVSSCLQIGFKSASVANNDNRRGLRLLFTQAEIQQLGNLFDPYIRGGKVVEPIYMLGRNLSCILFNRPDRPQSPVVFIAMKELCETGNLIKKPPEYHINFGEGKTPPDSSINFSSVLQHGKNHLEDVFGLAPQSTRLALIYR